MTAEGEEEQNSGEDPRMAFISQFCLKTMKQKSDKWSKMMSQEDNVVLLQDFLEKGDSRMLIVYVTPQGQLQPTAKFPTSTKNKAVYFIKRKPEAIKKDTVATLLVFGDMSYTPLDQLSSLVDAVSVYANTCDVLLVCYYFTQVMLPLLANDRNHHKWPRVVTADVMRNVTDLKGNVFVFSGQVKGKTLLPLPARSDNVAKAAERQEQ